MTKSSREDCINLAILLIDKNANTRPVSSPVLQIAISLWKHKHESNLATIACISRKLFHWRCDSEITIYVMTENHTFSMTFIIFGNATKNGTNWWTCFRTTFCIVGSATFDNICNWKCCNYHMDGNLQFTWKKETRISASPTWITSVRYAFMSILTLLQLLLVDGKTSLFESFCFDNFKIVFTVGNMSLIHNRTIELNTEKRKTLMLSKLTYRSISLVSICVKLIL